MPSGSLGDAPGVSRCGRRIMAGQTFRTLPRVCVAQNLVPSICCLGTTNQAPLLEPNFSLGWKWDSSTYGRTWGGIGILDVVYITNVQGRYTKSTNEAAMHSTSSQNRQYEERCGVKSETVGFQSRVANQSPFRVI